jgi:hypothetical protein|tara:strand:+ start:176 stop:1138 length:963 start_codon:yes stop_codon:yes gene_type:complete
MLEVKREQQRERERTKREQEDPEHEQRKQERALQQERERAREESQAEAIRTAKTVRSLLYKLVHEICENGEERAPNAAKATVLLESSLHVSKVSTAGDAKFWKVQQVQLRSDGSIWLNPHETRCRQIAPILDMTTELISYELHLGALSTISHDSIEFDPDRHADFWRTRHFTGYDAGTENDSGIQDLSALFSRQAHPRMYVDSQPPSGPRTYADIIAADPLGVSLIVWPFKYAGADDYNGEYHTDFPRFMLASDDNKLRDRWHMALRALVRESNTLPRPWALQWIVKKVWPEKGPWSLNEILQLHQRVKAEPLREPKANK